MITSGNLLETGYCSALLTSSALFDIYEEVELDTEVEQIPSEFSECVLVDCANDGESGVQLAA